METKMRIRLFSEDEKLVSDRLVEQKTEFTAGPKSSHKGPISLEVNLRTSEDVDSTIDYLRKVKGDLPITVKEAPEKKSKSLESMLKDKEPLQDLLNNALLKGTTQEKLIEFLRQYNFVFIAADVVDDMSEGKPDLFSFKKEKHKEYQYLIRQVKQAKDPKNDKFDLRLAFGVKIVGQRVEKVLVYFWGKFKTFKEIPWENSKKINFKKVEKILTFPEFMDYADRRKWRLEHRKKDSNPNYEPSKFYNKWKEYVKIT